MATIDTPSSIPATNALDYWIPVAATGAAFFMIVLDTSIVNLALSSIGADLGANVASLQWLVDGYALVFASLLLSAGAIGDRAGAKGVFMLGLLLFTLSSVLCGLAPSLGALELARVAQGVGAALLLPNSLAALNHTFGDPAQRGRAIATWASAGALGIAVGPVLGGALVQALGWRSIFLVNLPVGLLALHMTHRHVPRAPSNHSRSIDPAGQVLAVAFMAAGTYVLIESPRLESDIGTTTLAAGAFALLALLFIWHEKRHPAPMLPLALLKIPTLGPVAAVGLLHNVSVYGLIFVISLKLQRISGLDSLHAGLLFLPMTAALAIGTRAGGKILRAYGPLLPLVAGHLAAAAGALILSIAGNQLTALEMAIPFAIIGLGAGVTTPAMSVAVLNSVPRDLGGLASGILNSARQAGGVIGVAVLGSMLGDPIAPAGVVNAELTAAVVLFAAALFAFQALRGAARQG